ncbi:MAG: LysM peptidoglycan-binding domain-containing protein [Bacteroidota bacterium]
MALQDKYRSVLNLGEALNTQDGDVKEENGVLKISGTVETQAQKDRLWDEIKRVGGDNPSDLMANIQVSNTAYYDKYTVKSGDSLSKIAKAYYGDAMKYKDIFAANTDQLDNPDVIHPGQELVIPFPGA